MPKRVTDGTIDLPESGNLRRASGDDRLSLSLRLGCRLLHELDGLVLRARRAGRRLDDREARAELAVTGLQQRAPGCGERDRDDPGLARRDRERGRADRLGFGFLCVLALALCGNRERQLAGAW